MADYTAAALTSRQAGGSRRGDFAELVFASVRAQRAKFRFHHALSMRYTTGILRPRSTDSAIMMAPSVTMQREATARSPMCQMGTRESSTHAFFSASVSP